MPITTFHSRVYNPATDDYDAIIAAAAPRILVGSTFLSPTAIRLDFAPGELTTPLTSKVLPPYLRPPKGR